MSNPVTNLRIGNLIDRITFNSSFKTLCKALDTANLTRVMRVSGPYTIFAPIDEAFGKLPVGTLGKWLDPEHRTELIAVLKYHIFPGRALAVDVRTMSSPKMMLGQSANIAKVGQGFTINGAHQVGTEISASNGVIHAIDGVIQPHKSATLH